MKNRIRYSILFLFLQGNISAIAGEKETDLNAILIEWHHEIEAIRRKYTHLFCAKETEIALINRQLNKEINLENKVDLLIKKGQLQEDIQKLKKEGVTEVSKIRYLKGLQIIKILYEKVLSLDHHFASVRTFNEINKIANPNQYPEYNKLKEIIATKREKKSGFDLTTLLGANTIISVVQTFSNMINSNLSKEEKETELAKVECILDLHCECRTT